MSSYSLEIARRIKNFLDTDKWHYKFDSEAGTFKFGLNLECKLKSIDYLIRVKDNDYSCYATCKMGAKDCLPEMAEFISRANYGLRNGNFELDFRDGEIRYKTFVDCAETEISSKVVKNSIYIPALMFEKYGNGIAMILFGMKTPEEAINDCEKD